LLILKKKLMHSYGFLRKYIKNCNSIVKKCCIGDLTTMVVSMQQTVTDKDIGNMFNKI